MNKRKEMEETKQLIANAIRENEKQIKHLPKGRLQCFKNGDSFKWFKISSKSENGKAMVRHYIPKSDENIAESLAYKAFLQAQVKADKEELAAVDMYLRHCNTKNYADDYLLRSPEHMRLVNSARNKVLAESDEEVKSWLADCSSSVAPNPERLTYMSQAGYPVRSKSEQIIVALLMRHKIPFKYEQCIYASGKPLYPDFMIMHPITHKIFIWEHLGMMDKENYLSHNLWKIGEYAKIGFLPGDNLILTYETKDSGCDEVLAEYLVRHYLKH